MIRDLVALWRTRHLLWVLTRRDIAARYAGTAAGIVWAYAQPLLMVAAYYLVFDVVFAMRMGDQAPTRRVGAYLIVGALPWMAFCEAVTRGMNSLLESGSVLQKNALPPVLFPARSVLASMVVFGPLILLMVLAYAPLHHFSPAVLALLPLLVCQCLLCFVFGYLLAIMAAALRDTVQVVGFLFSVGIFISPVLFPLTQFPENWRWVLWINPITPFALGYQAMLLQGSWPTLASWFAIAVWLGVTSLVLQMLLERSRDQLVDWL